jgi:hypothetical protein
VSAAHNETYGRSLVEALRCGLPIVTMGCSNLHVRHEDNGLLGSDESQLAAQIRRVVRDGALRRRLKASVTGAQNPPDPNAQMLATVLDVHQRGAQLQAAAACAVAPSSAPSQPPMPSCPNRPPPRICMRAVAAVHIHREARLDCAVDFAPPKAGPVRAPPAGDVMAPRLEPLHADLRRRRSPGARRRGPHRPCDASRTCCARLRAVLPPALRSCRATPRGASKGAEAQPQPPSAQGAQGRLIVPGKQRALAF